MAFPKSHNLEYYRGDTFEFTVDVKNQDGSNFALTDYETYTFKIANQRGAGATQYTGTAIKVEPAGVKCTITSAVGRTMAAGQYFYDVQITDTTPTPNIIFTILTGILNVTDDVSGAV